MNASSGPETGETTRLQLASEIVTAYVGNNPVPATQLPELIRSVVAALANLDSAVEQQNAAPLSRPCRSASRSRPTTSSAWRTAGS